MPLEGKNMRSWKKVALQARKNNQRKKFVRKKLGCKKDNVEKV